MMKIDAAGARHAVNGFLSFANGFVAGLNEYVAEFLSAYGRLKSLEEACLSARGTLYAANNVMEERLAKLNAKIEIAEMGGSIGGGEGAKLSNVIKLRNQYEEAVGFAKTVKQNFDEINRACEYLKSKREEAEDYLSLIGGECNLIAAATENKIAMLNKAVKCAEEYASAGKMRL